MYNFKECCLVIQSIKITVSKGKIKFSGKMIRNLNKYSSHNVQDMNFKKIPFEKDEKSERYNPLVVSRFV